MKLFSLLFSAFNFIFSVRKMKNFCDVWYFMWFMPTHSFHFHSNNSFFFVFFSLSFSLDVICFLSSFHFHLVCCLTSRFMLCFLRQFESETFSHKKIHSETKRWINFVGENYFCVKRSIFVSLLVAKSLKTKCVSSSANKISRNYKATNRQCVRPEKGQ